MLTITWKGSPNFDKNRVKIDTIVIHWFGIGTLESANTRFQNDASDASAHYGISDNRVWQWVKEEHVAYHAGVYPINQRSIGIEHDATTTKNPSEATYQTSGELVAAISKRHGITLDRAHVKGHREFKATQCPGVMDIDKIINIAKGFLTPTPTPPTGGGMVDFFNKDDDQAWRHVLAFGKDPMNTAITPESITPAEIQDGKNSNMAPWPWIMQHLRISYLPTAFNAEYQRGLADGGGGDPAELEKLKAENATLTNTMAQINELSEF